VTFGHLADDGQPEAGSGHTPGRTGPVEAVEHMRQVVRGDTGPVVGYREFAVPQADLHRAARRTELGRVVQQVPDRDLQPLGAADDDVRLKIGREAGPRPIPAAGGQGGGDHLVQVDILVRAGDGLAPGELGDAAHQLAELGDLGHHPVEHLLTLGRRQARIVGQQLDVDTQAGQWRTQLVASVADQLPLGGQ